MAKSTVVGFRVSESERKRLEALALLAGCNTSELMRGLVKSVQPATLPQLTATIHSSQQEGAASHA